MYYCAISPYQVQVLQNMINKADADGSGTVNPEELPKPEPTCSECEFPGCHFRCARCGYYFHAFCRERHRTWCWPDPIYEQEPVAIVKKQTDSETSALLACEVVLDY